VTDDIFEKPADDGKPDKPVAKKRGRPPKNRLSIKRREIQIPDLEPRKTYWCGVIPDCPRGCVHAGGIDFPAFVNPQIPDAEVPGRSKVDSGMRLSGTFHDLTDEHVAKVLEEIRLKVFRGRLLKTMKPGPRGKERYVPDPNDEPLAKYVYMIEVPSTHSVSRTFPPENVEVLLEE